MATEDYRLRIYERYATKFTGRIQPASNAELDRWGAAFDTFLAGWLPEDRQATIADLACGDGPLLRFFTARGYEQIVGVDISAEQVELAKAVHPNVVHADVIEFLETQREAFDLITGLDIIEHLTKSEALEFLDRCHRALKPGGRLILQTPNMNSPFGLMIRYGDNTHENGFTPKSLEAMLKLCDYEHMQSRETGPIRRGLKGTLRWIAWHIVRLNLTAYNMIETGSTRDRVFTRVFLCTGVKA